MTARRRGPGRAGRRASRAVPGRVALLVGILASLLVGLLTGPPAGPASALGVDAARPAPGPASGPAPGPAPNPAAGPAGAPAPGWTWPIASSAAARVVHGFQPGLARWDPGHRGVDLAGPAGAPVLAAAAGVVRFAGQVGGKPVVVVGHGALRTTYEPVRAEVRVGQRVAAGQRLGRLVATPSHCLPAACLHLGLKRGDTYLDPLSVLRFRVRLLPLLQPGWPSPR